MKERRAFLKYSSLGFFGVCAGVLGASEKSTNRLRPPGAANGRDFLALCIKCGQCLQSCPYHSIKLDGISSLLGIGTPYIDARERGCYLCPSLPCILACPTGALEQTTEKPEDVKMGIAVFISRDRCLGVLKKKVPKSALKRVRSPENEQERSIAHKLKKFEGEECTICADMCPHPEPLSAIEMARDKNGGKYPLVKAGCVGCGVCEELCPAADSAIIIRPKVDNL